MGMKSRGVPGLCLAFLLGALTLCLFSVPQKLILGVDPYILRGFIVPVLFGGSVGLLLRLATVRVHRENYKLKERNDTLRALLDATTESIFLMDTEGYFVAINAVGAARLGHKPEDLVGKCSFDLLPDTLSRSRKKILEKIVSSQQAVRHTDEREGRLFDNSVHPVLNEMGKVVYLAVFSIDITDQKQMEKSLLESETRFRGLIESSSDWIWAIDAGGRYTYVSPRVQHYLGYEPQEVIGKTPFELMPPQEAERVRSIFAEKVAAGKPLEAVANVNLSKSGRKVVFETSGVPIFDADGKLSGYQGVDRDITDRQRMEVQREKLIVKLQKALAEIKELQGFLPICAECKKIRDDEGYWQQIEEYIQDHTRARFSHGICPDCARTLYPEIYPEDMENVGVTGLNASPGHETDARQQRTGEGQ